MKNKRKKPDLTEKEKQVVHLYLDEHKTYPEIMKIERCSPNFISRALKKHAGELTDENEQDENYAEMYQLFSIGKQPLQVAIALNLPLDYVSEQYIEYLKSKRMYSFVQLYERIGDGGIRTVLRGHNSMVKTGFANKPELVGPYLRYSEEMYNEGMYLEKMRESSINARRETLNARNELQELNGQISKATRTLADKNKAIEESKKELARINDAIVYQLRTHPFITAAQAGREAAESVLNDRTWQIRTVQEVYLNVIQNNIFVRWLYIPETRPEAFDRFSEKQIVAYCQKAIDQAAIEYFNRVLNEAIRRASTSRP